MKISRAQRNRESTVGLELEYADFRQFRRRRGRGERALDDEPFDLERPDLDAEQEREYARRNVIVIVGPNGIDLMRQDFYSADVLRTTSRISARWFHDSNVERVDLKMNDFFPMKRKRIGENYERRAVAATGAIAAPTGR